MKTDYGRTNGAELPTHMTNDPPTSPIDPVWCQKIMV